MGVTAYGRKLGLRGMMRSTRKEFGVSRVLEDNKSLEKYQDLRRSKEKDAYQRHGGMRSARRVQELDHQWGIESHVGRN